MPKFEGEPQEIFDKLCEWIEKNYKKDKLIVYISIKETKEMLLHSQRKMFRGLFGEISNHLGEDAEDIKQNFLKGIFGTKTITMGKLSFENAIKPITSELLKDEAKFFIDNIIKFIEKYKVPCKYTSADFKNLIETYEKMK